MNGTLYQGSKPVMWSPVEKTALAEAEVEYHDRDTQAIWVKFPVVAGDLTGSDVVIFTTTPWTIPQNRAVSFGPNIAYGLYEITGTPEECWASVGDKYILADAMAAEVLGLARLKDDMFKRVADVTADQLAGLTCAHPLREAEGAHGEWDYDVPLLPGDHVTDDAGTGLVHTAPSHGDDDYAVGVKHGLPMTYNILDDSSYRADLPFFAGEVIIKPNGKPGNANKVVQAKLVEVGAMLASKRVTLSDAHSWRSKAPVIRLNRPQWFAAIDKPVGDGQDMFGTTIRQRALTEIDNVKWTPQSGRNRLFSMMEARPDWVLSRQRAWGVPLTVFTKNGAGFTDDDYLLRDEEVNARILEAFEEEGADAYYKDGAKERFLSGIVNPDDYTQVMDILDVWFDSGSTHAFTLRDREDGTEDGIADVYMEGTDQHRGWFHSSLLQSVGTTGRAPYRNVVTHGFTLDEKGMKMSKSIGNTIVPEAVIKQYGADILRLWVAQTDFTVDQRIGPEILKGVADSYRRLRNTFRYLLGSRVEGTPAMPVAEMPELERWVLHRLAQIDAQVRDAYAKFDFQAVWQTIFTFSTVELSAFYFDIRKDALYCDGTTNRRQAARHTLDLILERLNAWLAPILVFTMEEVWLERSGGEGSIHLQDIPETPSDWLDDDLAAKWAKIRRVRRVVTGALEIERQNKTIGSSLEAAPEVYVDADTAALLESVDFEDICITSQIKVIAGEAPDVAFTLEDTPGVGVVFKKAEGQKCQRSWKILPEVGQFTPPDVTKRDAEALAELGWQA